jgi:Recombination endonuclease VII
MEIPSMADGQSEVKTCRTCLKELPRELFTKKASNKDGLEGSCITCRAHARRRGAYDLEPEVYLRMLFSQNSECAVCRISQSEVTAGLVVDHKHSDGMVRMLLCSNCNVALGLVKEDPKILQAMIEYLEVWK